MTPAKRRPATPASRKPTRVAPAPKVPTAPPDAPVPDELVTAPVPPAETNDSTQLLGPDGVPVAPEALSGDAGGDSAPPTETGQAAPEDRATTQTPGRPRALHPQRVWPD